MATIYTMSRTEKRVKDIVWTAVISIALASLALLVGVIGIFTSLHVTELVQGAGLASVTFGLAGLSDKFDPHASRRRE